MACGGPVPSNGEVAEQLVSLVLAAGSVGIRRAGVGLVDDNEFRCRTDELIAAGVALDEVGGDDRVGQHIEDRLVGGTVATFEAPSCARQYEFGVKVKLLAELFLPPLSQVRRTEHGESRDGAVVKQFAGNEAGFDRLP